MRALQASLAGRRADRRRRRPSRLRASAQKLTALSEWPTIPQVFVKGELIGGADITEELFASGRAAGRKLDEALGADRGAGREDGGDGQGTAA